MSSIRGIKTTNSAIHRSGGEGRGGWIAHLLNIVSVDEKVVIYNIKCSIDEAC